MYTYELENTFFNKNCTKRHKFGAQLVERPIRLAYINELDDGKLDGEFFKKFGDCNNLPLDELYGTVMHRAGTPRAIAVGGGASRFPQCAGIESERRSTAA